ncbi:MAG: hypothetical protein OXC00_00365 [Acidimicrobiaceae bacterium]|nr:hypothetical protein [Acidimicrobiaceae bacterium]
MSTLRGTMMVEGDDTAIDSGRPACHCPRAGCSIDDLLDGG